uniref:Uncharacterized protein n=1 Tax=Oryza glumipatula TaxID=40148 RepID=A0A0D9ZNK6_9ORYZ
MATPSTTLNAAWQQRSRRSHAEKAVHPTIPRGPHGCASLGCCLAGVATLSLCTDLSTSNPALARVVASPGEMDLHDAQMAGNQSTKQQPEPAIRSRQQYPLNSEAFEEACATYSQ